MKKNVQRLQRNATEPRLLQRSLLLLLKLTGFRRRKGARLPRRGRESHRMMEKSILNLKLPKRSTDTNALLKDVLIIPSVEESALSMGQRPKYVAAKGAQITQSVEECA